uniref:Uncharacterized protein n=1 Tax=Candidatus Kentrum sp. FM TaxID=2126340 RepID=A0A450S6Z2_9GAMM|nr:MAG: hypothetical protein BECKFM1743A_GA0114220_1004412 [Candidatus Kentron sp. FM]VFJ47646.1 MAG: hypothetical protein BECKFM1743C_GA0114222_1004811 [Candidatus Kentron sp. FM]VFK07660.1 MAG: hypothetical protein BECKFM1743B_GA0114221_1004711 [Candidatus Kentron sp. FM]
MDVYLYQSSGDRERRNTMRRLLREKGFAPVDLKNDTPLEGPDTLLFCHSSDCDGSLEDKVKRAAMEGAMLVYYSGGLPREKEGEEPTGKGLILYLAWNTVPELLRRLPKDFKREDITATWRDMRRCDLINALAILCKAVTVETNRRSSKDVQEKWRSDRERWKKILPRYTRDDFLSVCDGLLFGESAKGISEVRKLVDWMTGIDAPKPSFEKALEQMKKKFGLVV